MHQLLLLLALAGFVCSIMVIIEAFKDEVRKGIVAFFIPHLPALLCPSPISGTISVRSSNLVLSSGSSPASGHDLSEM